MFVDDLLLYKVIYTPSDVDALQYDVNALVQYIIIWSLPQAECIEMQISSNLKKAELSLFSTS